MKRIVLVVVLALVVNFSFAQYSDAKLKEMETKIEQQGKYIDNINTNMRSHARQFKAGTTMIILGTAATIAGSLIAVGTQNVNSGAGIIMGTGFALTSVGTIVQWTSNRWFKYGSQTQDEWIDQLLKDTESRRNSE
jgi:hypothetical protein